MQCVSIMSTMHRSNLNKHLIHLKIRMCVSCSVHTSMLESLHSKHFSKLNEHMQENLFLFLDCKTAALARFIFT